jgi:hypothetical protein
MVPPPPHIGFAKAVMIRLMLLSPRDYRELERAPSNESLLIKIDCLFLVPEENAQVPS